MDSLDFRANDYYGEIAGDLRSANKKFKEESYRRQNTQNPLARVFILLFLSFACIVAIFPFVFLVGRTAAVHEAQNGIFRLKEMTENYRAKSDEIREKLEAQNSLGDLEIFAVERLGMVKSDRSKIIIIEPLDNKVKSVDFNFTVSSKYTYEEK